MPKIQGHDFNIGASFRVFPKKEINAKVITVKGSIKSHGSGVKVEVSPVSGEKTFIDIIDKFVNDISAPVDIVSTNNSIKPNHLLDSDEEKSYSAYTGTQIFFKTPVDIDGTGDVIISWTKEDIDPLEPTHFEACCWLSKTLDHYLGLCSLLWDKNHSRRSDRGLPGLFSPTSSGMKYKMLSNLWVAKPQLRCFVYNNTLEAIKALFNEEKVYEKHYLGNSVYNILTEGDPNVVANLLKYSDIKAPSYYREKLGIAKEAA